MKAKLVAALKKVWGVLVLLGAAVFAVILFKQRKSSPTIEKSPKDPPKDIKSPDVVKDFESKKKESNEKIDNLGRDELVSDINTRYK